MERSFVLAEMAEYLDRFKTDDGRLPDECRFYSEVTAKLRFRYQNVRTVMVQSREAHLEDQRGRPPAVPE
jgi:hypothetical protein